MRINDEHIINILAALVLIIAVIVFVAAFEQIAAEKEFIREIEKALIIERGEL